MVLFRTMKNLWIISLAYCPKLPKTLSSLSEFACLGFVDLSFTEIRWSRLQETLRKTHVIRLNCFGCPQLKIELSSREDESETELHGLHRGFAVTALPLTWMLNGVFASWIEMKKWREYFFGTWEGSKSVLFQKWKTMNREIFVPSRLLNDAPEGPSQDDNSIIWSNHAKEWLVDMPVSFSMSVDYDNIRLNHLSHAFMGMFDLDTKLQNLIGDYVGCASSHYGRLTSLDERGILLILLFASFFEDIPKRLLCCASDQAMSTCGTSGRYPLSSEELHPLHWKPQDRIHLGSLILARLTVEMPLATRDGERDHFLLDENSLRGVEILISSLIRMGYPVPDEEFKSMTGFNYDEHASQMSCSIDFSSLVHSLPRPYSIPLGWAMLDLIQWLSLLLNDIMFLKEFPLLNSLLITTLEILADGPLPTELLIPPAEARDVQTWNEHTVDSQMGIEAKTTEIKLRWSFLIKDVLGKIDTKRDESDSQKKTASMNPLSISSRRKVVEIKNM